ncbi:hypothetical protein [Pseudolysinimonas sp.]|uniref:hypothetical protein n=1 Tax=Pseudolysinimonas sp. TaxID=2680009 RepID=UPI003F81A7CC
MSSTGGVLVSVARVGLALHDAADVESRVRLRRADGSASAAAWLALAREVAQGVLLLGAGRRAHRLGGVVDMMHGASMLAYAVVRPGRGGAAEAARAAGFALAEWELA